MVSTIDRIVLQNRDRPCPLRPPILEGRGFLSHVSGGFIWGIFLWRDCVCSSNGKSSQGRMYTITLWDTLFAGSAKMKNETTEVLSFADNLYDHLI